MIDDVCACASLRWVTGAWMLYAFIVTAGYSGSLRAFLMNPKMKEPIETMEDLVAQDEAPYYMVLWGEEVETYISQSQDPALKKFWKDKVAPEYGTYVDYDLVSQARGRRHNDLRSCFKMGQILQIDMVYEGKILMVDWYPAFFKEVNSGFRLPNGELLLHVGKDLGLTIDLVRLWTFHPMNPWFEHFNFYLHHFFDIGLSRRLVAKAKY